MGLLRLVVTLAITSFRLFASGAEQTPPQPAAIAPLSLEQVLRLARDGISEDVLITRIKQNGKPFDLSRDELLELKRGGVTDTVIKFLLDPAQPYVPPAPRPDPPAPAPIKPAAPTRKYPEDPYVSRVPVDPGLYLISAKSVVPAPVQLFLGEKQGGGLGKVLLKKGRVVAYLVGSGSRIRVVERSSVFYLRLPEGKGIEELLLLALTPRNGRRELELGPPGPKAEFKPETIRQFDSLEVGAGVFRLSPVGLANGEYVFFLRGSEDPSKGNYGKGYDFGIGAESSKGKR